MHEKRIFKVVDHPKEIDRYNHKQVSLLPTPAVAHKFPTEYDNRLSLIFCLASFTRLIVYVAG